MQVGRKCLFDQITAAGKKNVEKNVQSETHIRECFRSLNASTKDKVESFGDGNSAGIIAETHSFRLPFGLPTKDHFRLLNHIRFLF